MTSCSSAQVVIILCLEVFFDSNLAHTDASCPTDSGLVLKAIHLPKDHGQSQEITLEQMQVFQVH